MPVIMICNELPWIFNPDIPEEYARWATPEALGFLPGFINGADARPAREQLDTNYGFDGNWQSAPAGILSNGSMTYPGDPPLPWVARTMLRDEHILIYPYGFVAVIAPDGSFASQRMD
jgi:hypothetical protein